MLKVALCDDEAEQRAALGDMLAEYAAARPALTVKLSVFSSGRELMNAVEESGPFDIYLLDVVMPELSGIGLGVRLREADAGATIIYLSVSPEYAVDSYSARAFYYLIKPSEPARLFQVLDEAVAAREKRRTACVTVKTQDGLHLVRLDELLFAELSGRSIRYHLVNGETVESTTVRGSFQEAAAPLLADPRFFLCGASYAANLFYVTAVEHGHFLMDGGKCVPLSRALYAQARQRWQDYWLDSDTGGGVIYGNPEGYFVSDLDAPHHYPVPNPF